MWLTGYLAKCVGRVFGRKEVSGKTYACQMPRFGAFWCEKPRSKLHRLSHEPNASAAQAKTPLLPEVQDITPLRSDLVIIVQSQMAGKIRVGM